MNHASWDKFISGPTLQFEFYLPDNFGKKLIVGLDIYELSDLIIFMTITNILEKKIRKRAQFQFFLKTRAHLGPFATQQDLICICLAKPS